MNKYEVADRFSRNLERERIKLDLTQKEMASRLEIHPQTYKKIINGETTKIDLMLMVKMYELTHKFTFELIEFDDDQDDFLRIITQLRQIPPSSLHIIERVIKLIKKHYKD